MKNLWNIIAALLVSLAMSCADKESPMTANVAIIGQEVLDSATVLVVDSTEHWFENVGDASVMLVYQDSLLIVSSRKLSYGKPILSFYERCMPLRHLADYISRGSDMDEMMACRVQLTGDGLFVNDAFYTGRYCTIGLRKPLLPADELHLLSSGVEERGAAAVPFHDGLLVENPQCYANDEAGIRNDVPRLLFYRQGHCLTPQEKVAYQVADVNTGADIHYSEKHQRVCFVSHRQPLVEFYDDSLQLVHRLRLQSEVSQQIHIDAPHTVMHQTRHRGEAGKGVNATFDKTQRVVGASNQFHAFLCSAADENHIFLVYCGQMFTHDFHTYPSYILVLDWNGHLTATYRFDRWIQAISPSREAGGVLPHRLC